MSLSEKLEAARVARGKRMEREQLKAEPTKPGLVAPAQGNNKLLAGYLAHEFLARGTVLGRRIEPSRPPPSSASASAPAPAEPDAKRRFTEVSWLLMMSGAHIPGVVNPTQLGRWLQMKE